MCECFIWLSDVWITVSNNVDKNLQKHASSYKINLYVIIFTILLIPQVLKVCTGVNCNQIVLGPSQYWTLQILNYWSICKVRKFNSKWEVLLISPRTNGDTAIPLRLYDVYIRKIMTDYFFNNLPNLVHIVLCLKTL